jgi:hypothetical protein
MAALLSRPKCHLTARSNGRDSTFEQEASASRRPQGMDPAMDQPMEDVLRQPPVALRLAKYLGLAEPDRAGCLSPILARAAGLPC